MLVSLLTQQGGILKPFAWIMGIILDGIYEFMSLFGIHNIAICIIIFTIVTRMIMLPLTIKQQKFSKLQSKMSPELTAISEKYKGKKDEASQRKMQAETQEVYDRYGTTPMGGCLPLLITLPIMFALYRVIYKIPAYIGDIYELYENVVNVINSLVSTLGAQGLIAPIMDNFVNGYSITSAVREVEEMSNFAFGTEDYIKSFVDILTQFNSTGWTNFLQGGLLETDSWNAVLAATSQTADTWVSYLQSTLGSNYMTQLANMTDISELGNLLGITNLGDTVVLADLQNCVYWNTFTLATDFKNVMSAPEIGSAVEQILQNNSFIGNMNILDNSGYRLPGILIPIFAAGTQFLQSKMTRPAEPSTKKAKQEESPMAQSMKSMTTIMPIMSGVICVMLPIGVGIYWIAGTVVQIVQQFFINRYLNKVDVDEMIAKSVEKANKKKAKYGVRTNGNGAVSSVAKTTTKTVEAKKYDNTPAYNKPREVSDYTRPSNATGTGGIADIANILRDKNTDKSSKKKASDGTSKEARNNGEEGQK